jgi:ABC-2 type transport system permease protein
MRKFLTITWYELFINLQNWQNWLILFIVPALVIYLVGLGTQGIAGSLMPVIRIDILDSDQSSMSQTLTVTLNESHPVLVVCPNEIDPTDPCGLAGEPLSPELADERLANYKTTAILTIPQGCETALNLGEMCTLQFQAGLGIVAPEIALIAIQNAASVLGAPIVTARLGTELAEALDLETGSRFFQALRIEANEAWTSPPVQVITETTEANERLILASGLLENGFSLSAPSITITFITISILMMVRSLAEERMLGILKRMGMMPLRKIDLLGGRLLGIFILGMSVFSVLFGFGRFLGVDFGDSWWAPIGIVSAYILAVTAIAFYIATFTRTPNQASSIVIITWIVLIPLGGGWWPLELVPSWLGTLGHISPVAWCMDGLNTLIFYQGAGADVLKPIVVLLLYTLIFFLLSIHKSISFWDETN